MVTISMMNFLCLRVLFLTISWTWKNRIPIAPPSLKPQGEPRNERVLTFWLFSRFVETIFLNIGKKNYWQIRNKSKLCHLHLNIIENTNTVISKGRQREVTQRPSIWTIIKLIVLWKHRVTRNSTFNAICSKLVSLW